MLKLKILFLALLTFMDSRGIFYELEKKSSYKSKLSIENSENKIKEPDLGRPEDGPRQIIDESYFLDENSFPSSSYSSSSTLSTTTLWTAKYRVWPTTNAGTTRSQRITEKGEIIYLLQNKNSLNTFVASLCDQGSQTDVFYAELVNRARLTIFCFECSLSRI